MTKILPLLPKHKARNLLPGAGGGQDKSIGREEAEAVVPGRPLRKAVNPRGGCSQLQRETDLLIHSATSEHQAGHDGDQHVPQPQRPAKAGSPEGPKHSQEPTDKSSRSRLKGNLRNQFPDPHLALALLPENARTLLSSQQLPSH